MMYEVHYHNRHLFKGVFYENHYFFVLFSYFCEVMIFVYCIHSEHI